MAMNFQSRYILSNNAELSRAWTNAKQLRELVAVITATLSAQLSHEDGILLRQDVEKFKVRNDVQTHMDNLPLTP